MLPPAVALFLKSRIGLASIAVVIGVAVVAGEELRIRHLKSALSETAAKLEAQKAETKLAQLANNGLAQRIAQQNGAMASLAAARDRAAARANEAALAIVADGERRRQRRPAGTGPVYLQAQLQKIRDAFN